MAWPDPSPRRTFRFRILSGSLFFRTDGSLLIGLVNLLARSSPNGHLGSRFWVLSGSVSFHTVSSLLIGLVNLLARSSPDGHLGSSWCTIFDLQTSVGRLQIQTPSQSLQTLPPLLPHIGYVYHGFGKVPPLLPHIGYVYHGSANVWSGLPISITCLVSKLYR